MAKNAIEVDHIYKTYADGTAAVDDVSFRIPEGTCFGFLGPNGAGKTTLMKTLFGMVRRDRRQETRVSVFGFDPARDELAIKHLSGVVPQDNKTRPGPASPNSWTSWNSRRKPRPRSTTSPGE